MANPVLRPADFASLQEVVREHPSVWPRGAGTKTALQPPEGAVVLDLSQLRGVVDYDPAEFTFTALAGTPVREVEELLGRHGQYLPFDPPLCQAGATLGGTLASGLSGPGRYRYGGVRDFVLGVRFVDGHGQLVRAGGKVVKNAAGFDLAKLLVGSLGRLGVVAELSFKVFPAPRARKTVRVDRPDFERAWEVLRALYTSSFDLEALDLVPPGTVWVRVAGRPESLAARVGRLLDFLPRHAQAVEDDAPVWEEAREFRWVPPGWTLVKVPVTPRRLPELEGELARGQSLRRYSAGGNVAWVAWPEDVSPLAAVLDRLGLRGLRVLGPPGPPFLGRPEPDGFGRRVKQALDPLGRFGPHP
jgi:glycolate oxidase FAD binding subunit